MGVSVASIKTTSYCVSLFNNALRALYKAKSGCLDGRCPRPILHSYKRYNANIVALALCENRFYTLWDILMIISGQVSSTRVCFQHE